MAEKAADAFRTISEVAEDLDVPQHVLRFWETRFAQVKPMKRAGGRRYYRPTDVDLLQGIRKLLYAEGYTIKGVQRILKEDGVAHVGSIGRGEASPRKRDSEEDEAPAPAIVRPALKIGRPAPAPGRAPLARPKATAEAATPVYRLSESHMSSLNSALKDLTDARKIRGAKD